MGSCSAGEANTNGIDASEGALVWVRRRNGSWWPGRIMGLHELSQSCLVSPRSGTPVKLLGRQDASVDWYNLEKSKRVKAFRCGEYDECIEKAKASAANSNKKAVKYARREDAIIHALELESARVGKEPLAFCSRTGKFGNENGVSGGDSLVVSHSADGNEDISDDEDNSNSAPELSQSGISFEDPNQNDSTKMQSMPGRRRRTPNDSEDDGMEGVKRMRGLEDLGVGVVSKRKGSGTSMPEMLQQDSTAHNSSNTGSYLVNGTIFNGVKGQYSSLKRKRSQVTNAHESLKRKSRRRQLTKVLESTAMVSVPVTCDQLPTSTSSLICTATDGKNSRLDSNDLKKSSLQAINNSNSNEAACENGSSLNIHDQGCEASEISDMVKKEAPGTSHKFIRDVGNEKHSADLSPALVSCSSGKPQDGVLGQQSFQVCQSEAPSLRNGSHRIEKGSSKWQSKGKRNLRNKSKNRKGVPRKQVNMDNEASISGMPNSDGVSQGAGPKVEASILGGTSASYNLTTQRCKQVAEGEVDGFQDLGKHNMEATEMKVLPDGSLTPQRSLPRRQCRFTLNSKYQTADFPRRDHSSDASLFDVKLEVKSSYRPQHVPLISLASKLNGKAFIGHPLTVEVLDNGHCDTLLSGIRHDPPEGRDGRCMVRPNSTTKRRPSKNLSRYRKPSKTKKPSLLNKKIRRLSSLTGHRQSEGQRKPMADKAKGPVISCIPLKVVFSRINEAVSSQARSAHHGALPSSDP